MEEVYIEVNVPEGTSAKEIKCDIGNNRLSLSVASKLYFQVQLLACWFSEYQILLDKPG